MPAMTKAELAAQNEVLRKSLSREVAKREAQFKTLKYRPAFPARFGSIHNARAYCHDFFRWYILTPASAC